MLRDSLSRSNKRNAHTLLTDPKKAFSCAAFKALNLNKYLIATIGSNCPGMSGTVPDLWTLSRVPEGFTICPGCGPDSKK